MISERSLKQWRKDSLKADYITIDENDPTCIRTTRNHIMELHHRILCLTQELMDAHLTMKGR